MLLCLALSSPVLSVPGQPDSSQPDSCEPDQGWVIVQSENMSSGKDRSFFYPDGENREIYLEMSRMGKEIDDIQNEIDRFYELVEIKNEELSASKAFGCSFCMSSAACQVAVPILGVSPLFSLAASATVACFITGAVFGTERKKTSRHMYIEIDKLEKSLKELKALRAEFAAKNGIVLESFSKEGSPEDLSHAKEC